MQFAKLAKIGFKKHSKKRRGQGLGSGHGKTAGRGTKGQRAHGKVAFGFETGSRTTRLLKRLPFRRGVTNTVLGVKPIAVNLQALSILPKDTTVTADTLIAAGLVNARQAQKRGVKILGEGKLVHPLIIALPISKQAAQKVEEVGGKVVWRRAKEQEA